MDKLYLFSLVPILLTEYGFQSSTLTIHHMRRKFVFARIFARFLFWLLVASLTMGKYQMRLVMPVFSLFIAGEFCSQFIRVCLRKDLRSDRRYGSIKTHMVPFLFPGIVVPGMYIFLTLYLRRNGMHIDLGEALVAELLNPFIVLSTKAVLTTVIVISEWTWSSLIIRSIEERIQLHQDDGLLDPGRVRRELIGVIERLFTLMMVALGGHIGAGIVIAIKSTGRLPKLANRQDAEQFIVETLGSVGLATLGGLLIQVL